jgi:hypothetical protein
MTLASDPNLAERVRKAWNEWVGKRSSAVFQDVVAIAQAEADRAWNAALGAAVKPMFWGCDEAMRILALQRPQQPDKPETPTRQGVKTPDDAEGSSPRSPPLGDRPEGRVASPALLSHEWRPVFSDQFGGRRFCVRCGVRDTEEDEDSRCARAQSAPEVDVFEATARHWMRLPSDPCSETEALADLLRQRFGPALKALEDIEVEAIDPLIRDIATTALTALRERARRVSG